MGGMQGGDEEEEGEEEDEEVSEEFGVDELGEGGCWL